MASPSRRRSPIAFALSISVALISTLVLVQLLFIVYADRTAAAAASSGADRAMLRGARPGDGAAVAREIIESLPGLYSSSVHEIVDNRSITMVVEGKPFRLLPIELTVNASATREIGFGVQR